ncbi:hypothetical protein L9F63_010543, partial [Diploptera punctata]
MAEGIVSYVDNDVSPAQLSLEFRVFLVSAQTGKHTQESRTLQFWFTSSTSDTENATVAQEFFRELVSPQDFPRDYVGFIKKVMKLLQHGFKGIRKVEVTLTQLEESQVPPPTRPYNFFFFSYGEANKKLQGHILSQKRKSENNGSSTR